MEIKATNVFARNYTSQKRIIINQGGTRSSKTYSVCQIIALWFVTGNFKGKKLEKGVCNIVRKTLPALKSSVKKDFDEILNNWGVKAIEGYEENKTDLTYKFKGREVCFFSVDSEQKVRGRKSTILFLNEANELEIEDWRQLLMRTIGQVFIDFNPSDPFTWIKEELIDVRFHQKGDVEIIKSTYLDNLKFLSKEQIEEIEYLKQTDLDFWSIYGLGDFTKIRGIVYENWIIEKEIPNYNTPCVFGLDFGYSNDPTALVKVTFVFGKYYVQELIYEKGIDIDDLPDLMKEVGVKGGDLVVCDHLPQNIAYLRKKGINAIPAPSKDIKLGITIVRSCGIMHITADSTNLREEIKKYKYRLHNDKPTNEPIDKFNHCLDAVRYATVFYKNYGANQSDVDYQSASI